LQVADVLAPALYAAGVAPLAVQDAAAQATELAANTSAGQVFDAPVQASFTSHPLTAARH
jgi:hypothetical protein